MPVRQNEIRHVENIKTLAKWRVLRDLRYALCATARFKNEVMAEYQGGRRHHYSPKRDVEVVFQEKYDWNSQSLLQVANAKKKSGCK